MPSAYYLSAFDSPAGLLPSGAPADPKRLNERGKRRAASNPSAAYFPSTTGLFGAGLAALDGNPVFTYFDVPRMVRDPKVKFVQALYKAPFQKCKFSVKAGGTGSDAGDAKVAQFVQTTIERFKRKSLPKLLSRYFRYGWFVGAAEFVSRDGYLRLSRVRCIEPRDARPHVFRAGPERNQFAGFCITNGSVPEDQRFIGHPNAMWFAGYEEYGPFYDAPPLMGAFVPWLRKNTRGGAMQNTELAFRKNAGHGGILRHPPGSSVYGSDENPQVRNNQDIAREILDYQATFGAMVLENSVQPANPQMYEWDYTPPEITPGLEVFLQYEEQLDKQIVEGVGIPLEVAGQGSDSGSGYKGRLISYGGFLDIVTELMELIIGACDAWLTPLVRLNYGAGAWYECEVVSLSEIAQEEEKRSPAPGSPIGAPAPGLPGDGSAGGGAEGSPLQLSATAPPVPDPVLDVLKSLAASVAALAVRQLAPPAPAPAAVELAATVGPENTDPQSKQAALNATQQKLMRSRKATIAQLLAYAMVKKQQEATAAGKPEAAAGSLGALAELAGDPIAVSKIVGLDTKELSAAAWDELELAWVQLPPGPRGGILVQNTETGAVRRGQAALKLLQNQDRREKGLPTTERGTRRAKAKSDAEDVATRTRTGDVTAADMQTFAGALQHLSGAQLRETAKYLAANLRGERRVKQMVERLLAHVDKTVSTEETRAGAAAVAERDAGKGPPRGSKGARGDREAVAAPRPAAGAPAGGDAGGRGGPAGDAAAKGAVNPSDNTPEDDLPKPAIQVNKPPAPEEPEPEAVAEQPTDGPHEAATKLLGALDGAEGLSDEQKAHYRESMTRVVAAMPKPALDRVTRHLAGTTFHADNGSVGRGAVESAVAFHRARGATEEQIQQFRARHARMVDGTARVGGAYHNDSKQLHIDGAFRDARPGAALNGDWPTHGVYAHELGHVVDGPDRALSTSPEWLDAYHAEIDHPVEDIDAGKTARLSYYGGSKPSEGWAEFARLVYGSDVPHAQIERDFPKATAVLKANGLWPERQRGGESDARAMPELFQERIDLGPDGSHADVLKTPAPAPDQLPGGAPTAPDAAEPEPDDTPLSPEEQAAGEARIQAARERYKQRVAEFERERERAAQPAESPAVSQERTLADALRTTRQTNGMSPVHEMRAAYMRAHPDASPQDFDEGLLKMRREGKVRLIPIDNRSRATREQLRDSVFHVGETMFYAEPTDTIGAEGPSPEPAEPGGAEQPAAPAPPPPKPARAKKPAAPTSPAKPPSLAALKKKPLADKEHIGTLATRATGDAAEYLKSAAHNLNPRDLPPADSRHLTVERLAAAHRDALTAGDPEAAQQVARAVEQFGGKFAAKPGDTVKFDALYYDHLQGLRFDAQVKVLRPPVLGPGGKVAVKGAVEPVKPAPVQGAAQKSEKELEAEADRLLAGDRPAPVQGAAGPQPKRGRGNKSGKSSELENMRAVLDGLGIDHSKLTPAQVTEQAVKYTTAREAYSAIGAAADDNANEVRLQRLFDRAEKAGADIPDAERRKKYLANLGKLKLDLAAQRKAARDDEEEGDGADAGPSTVRDILAQEQAVLAKRRAGLNRPKA